MHLTSEAGRVRLGQVLLTVTAALLMLVAFALFRTPVSGPAPERTIATAPRVVVSEVGMQPFDLAVNAIGRVSPWREVSLAAEVSGRISAVHVDLGDRVSVGDAVVSIETDTYETAVREAEAAQLRARARLEESDASLNRTELLRDRGAVSEREYEAALAGKRAAQADVATAEAGLERAHRNLDDAELTAPFAGTIVERHVDAGALVGSDRTLLVLADLDSVAVEVGLTEREILLARASTEAAIESTSRSGHPVNGVIDGIAERADPATGTYLVRIRVDNRVEPRFLGGMVVEVEIPYAKLDAVTTVPAAAVVEPEVSPHVFVVREGRVRRVDVEVIARDADRLGVAPSAAPADPVATAPGVSGDELRVGDLVVIVGQSQLADGEEIEIASQR